MYMDRYCKIDLLDSTPVVTAAIHDGHHLSDEISQIIALDDDEITVFVRLLNKIAAI